MKTQSQCPLRSNTEQNRLNSLSVLYIEYVDYCEVIRSFIEEKVRRVAM